ncbi:hypothetical protein S83_007505 [Arachis hypogaea]
MPRTKSFTLMNFSFSRQTAFVLLHSHATSSLFSFVFTPLHLLPHLRLLSSWPLTIVSCAHQVIILCLSLYPLFLTCSHSLSLSSVEDVYGYDGDDELQWLIESEKVIDFSCGHLSAC